VSVLSNKKRRRACIGRSAPVPQGERHPSALITNCPEPAEIAGPKPDNQEQMRDLDHVLKILREGGYHCELLQDLPKPVADQGVSLPA